MQTYYITLTYHEILCILISLYMGITVTAFVPFFSIIMDVKESRGISHALKHFKILLVQGSILLFIMFSE